MGFVVEGWEANEGIENNCHQGIKEVPPTKMRIGIDEVHYQDLKDEPPAKD